MLLAVLLWGHQTRSLLSAGTEFYRSHGARHWPLATELSSDPELAWHASPRRPVLDRCSRTCLCLSDALPTGSSPSLEKAAAFDGVNTRLASPSHVEVDGSVQVHSVRSQDVRVVPKIPGGALLLF